MKSRTIVLALAVLLGGGMVQAESRVWTGNTGSQLSAELVEEAYGKVVLRDETGRTFRVPRSYLSEEDIAYLDRFITPVFGLQPDIRLVSAFKERLGVVQAVKYDIEFRKVSTDAYSQPITVSLYLVGSIGDEPTYLVLQRLDEEMRFTPEKQNQDLTGPDLWLGAPELQKKYDFEYVGYLLLLSTPDSRIIRVESDEKLLEANAGFISKFKVGDLFGKDMKLLE